MNGGFSDNWPVISDMLHGAAIFTYIWVIIWVNFGTYAIHGAYGYMV